MNVRDILIVKKAKKIENFDPIVLGTQTLTNVSKEQTDKDASSHNGFELGTQTRTFTQEEMTDSDTDRIQLGTQTVTKHMAEGTDEDR